MEEDNYNNLVENIKLLSKSNCSVEKSKLIENIKSIIRSFIINNIGEVGVNDKVTRDKIKILLVELFESIKSINKSVIACNELNNTSDVIDSNDLVVSVAIETPPYFHKFTIHIKE